MSNKEFEDIAIQKWKLVFRQTAGKVYRVFKNSTEFQTIEADSASEAALKSGIIGVYKIKYGSMDDTDYVDQTMLARDTA